MMIEKSSSSNLVVFFATTHIHNRAKIRQILNNNSSYPKKRKNILEIMSEFYGFFEIGTSNILRYA